MKKNKFLALIIFVLQMLILLSCSKPGNDAATSSSKFLYLTSGVCYSGAGNTTFTNLTSSNVVFRVNSSSGALDTILADYNSTPSSTGDSPVGIIDAITSVRILVENTTTTSLRRIEDVIKTENGSRGIYTNNTTALSAQLRGMIPLTDSYYLVSKSSAIEKTKDGVNRLTVGANAWVTLNNPPAASACAPNITLLSSMAVLNNGNIAFAHAAAAANRIGLVSAQGYSVLASCLNGNAVVAAPNANSYPTAMVYDGTNNKLIVAYAGNAITTDINSIYAYPINEAANTIGAGVKVYDASLFGSSPGWNFLLYGISAMTLDVTGGYLYVASAINTNTTVVNYQIFKLTYTATNIGVSNYQVLQNPTGNPFYAYGFDTKCISSMTLAY